MTATLRLLPLLAALLLSAGCTGMATGRLADNLSRAMLNQDDPETVRTGIPAYLLLVDGLITDSPEDSRLLLAGSRLYGAYGTTLVDDPERARRLTDRALKLARDALCVVQASLCQWLGASFDQFRKQLQQAPATALPALYGLGAAWAGWIQVRSDDWNALAQLPRVEALLQRVVELDPAYDRGRAQLYLGVLRTQLPPSLGGHPEQGRRHFELAIRYSGGRDLMAKVEYARRYARLVFDQALHDRLLHQVLEAPVEEPGLTLSNVLAQRQARRLLEEEYF